MIAIDDEVTNRSNRLENDQKIDSKEKGKTKVKLSTQTESLPSTHSEHSEHSRTIPKRSKTSVNALHVLYALAQNNCFSQCS